MSRRTETVYKAKSPGKVAQHIKAQDSGDMVSAAVVSRKITALIRGDLSDMRLGVAWFSNDLCDRTEVSRSHSRRWERSEDSPRRRAEHRRGKEPQ